MTAIPTNRSCTWATILRSGVFGLATIHLLVGCDHSSRSTPDAGASARPAGAPPLHAPLTSASKVDMLFLIDDSFSMAPWQVRLRERLPSFMNVLKNAPGGMPDVHVAVVSSSLGAGIFANVPGCQPVTEGNRAGLFQHAAGCGLKPEEAFIKSTGGTHPIANFDGDIADVFGCMANLGERGCGFEHQLASTRLSLELSDAPASPNHGFLRPDALLSVVMLTNEDDCSIAADSMLLDPGQISTADPRGGLNSYRCNEFGHRCNQPLPHGAPATPLELTECGSAEDGALISVGGFIDFLYGLKPGHPENVFVAVIAGPAGPYIVEGKTMQLADGTQEVQPAVAHSCMVGETAYADPGIRLAEVTAAFAPNSSFTSICADDFTDTMTGIAQLMVGQP